MSRCSMCGGTAACGLLTLLVPLHHLARAAR